jgi:hypothetical protein
MNSQPWGSAREHLPYPVPSEEQAMSGSANDRQRYRIILRGECQQLLSGILEGLTVESGRGRTSITASVRDESELYGLLDRLQEFALHIVSLNELGPEAPRPQAVLDGSQ